MRERTQEKKNKLCTESQFQPITSSIPDDILLEIFTRLPVRSLMRLSCVSTSWHSLISSPDLVKSHHKRLTEDKENEHRRIMFVKVERQISMRLGLNLRLGQFECSLHSAFSCAVPEKIEVTNNCVISFPAERYGFSTFKIVGSCYGLVLIMVDEEIMLLWNPATRKYRKLPDFGIKMEHKFSVSSCLSCGIGYDESNDDFKVLVLSCVFYAGMQYETLAKVYSRKTDSWKKIEDLKYCLIEQGCYYVNGIFHFTHYDLLRRDTWNITFERKIVGFDLVNDIFKEIELPEEVNNYDNWNLGTLEGCLSLLVCCRGNQVNLWIMEEYGVKESWTKMVVIPCFQDPDSNLLSTPLILSEDGQLLFVTWPSPKLGVYDPNQNSLKYSWFSNFNKDLYGAYVFLESLVSP